MFTGVRIHALGPGRHGREIRRPVGIPDPPQAGQHILFQLPRWGKGGLVEIVNGIGVFHGVGGDFAILDGQYSHRGNEPPGGAQLVFILEQNQIGLRAITTRTHDFRQGAQRDQAIFEQRQVGVEFFHQRACFGGQALDINIGTRGHSLSQALLSKGNAGLSRHQHIQDFRDRWAFTFMCHAFQKGRGALIRLISGNHQTGGEIEQIPCGGKISPVNRQPT